MTTSGLKRLAVIVALALVLVVAGCGGGGTRNAGNTGSYNKTQVRSYQADCGSAATIGGGSCNVVVGGIVHE